MTETRTGFELPAPDEPAPPAVPPANPPPARRARRPGRLSRFVLAAAAVVGIAYGIDTAADLRLLRPFRPFVELLLGADEGPPPVTTEQIAQATDQLDDMIDARLAGAAPPAALPAPPPAPGAAAPNTPAAAPKPRPLAVSLDGGDPVYPLADPCLAPDPEPCRARALDRFYAALERTARGEPGAVTRISHFGDSIIVEDLFTADVRRRLQKRFGDAGHGWLYIAKPWEWYDHQNVEFKPTPAWTIRRVTLQHSIDDRYGFGGVSFTALGPGSKVTYGPDPDGPVGRSFSRFELYGLAQPGGGTAEIVLDGEVAATISLEAPEVRSAWKRLEFADGPHTVVVRSTGGGPVRLFGVTLEREGPGVVYDSIGILGAAARAMLVADERHQREQFAHRKPDLVILQFGTNESDHEMTMTQYRQQLALVLARVRAVAPDASCLLVSPPDRVDPATRETRSIIPKIVEVQRELSAAGGCGFWNTYEAMGGRNSIHAWYRANPRRAFGDLTHLAPAGGEVLGGLFNAALLQGFVEYLDRGRTGDAAR